MDRNRLALAGLVGRGLRLAPLLFLLLFFFYPLAAIFHLSLMPDGVLKLGIFRDIVAESYYRKTLWFTFWQAALSTLLTLGLALPAAHVFTHYRFPGKSLLLALATLPFVLPTVVVAAAFKALIGNDSPLEETRTLILIAHVFYNYAVATRIISTFWAQQNQRMQEAAYILGASRWRVWRRVTLPLLMPAILAASTLVFMFTFTSFGVVLLLGGFRNATLEVEIYIQTTAFLDLNTAGALSIIQLLTTLLMMILYTRWQAPQAFLSIAALARPPRRWQEKLWVGINLVVLVVLIFAPLAALIERSIMVGQEQPSLHYYRLLTEESRLSRLPASPLQATLNSLRFALITTCLAVILGGLAAYLLAQKGRRWLDPLFMLPLATSAVTLGFGYIITFDEPPLNLRESFWIIPIAHTLVALPFVLRSVLPSLQAIRPSVREAAAMLGASAWRLWWRIELPLLAPSILVGAIFAFTVSMGEFGASVFIARPDQPNMPTIPVIIFRLLGLAGVANYGQALALSVLLMIICTTGFIIIERLNNVINRNT